MMKYKITLEVRVPDGTSFEDAEEFLQYTFGYSWKCDYNNPLTEDDVEVTDFNIEESREHAKTASTSPQSKS